MLSPTDGSGAGTVEGSTVIVDNGVVQFSNLVSLCVELGENRGDSDPLRFGHGLWIDAFKFH